MLLRMRQIRKAFAGIEVLHGVGLDLGAGEVHALVGENGAGKSTLVKVLSGVHTDYRGSIELDGRAVRFSSTRDAELAGISIIYQELNLVQELTAAENTFLGREPRRWGILVDYRQMNDRAGGILRELGSSASPTDPVSSLRVGARQMVEIAKALSLNARVMVMDEPTSALSEPEIEQLFAVVKQLSRRGVGIVYISHRFEEIFRIADRVTVLRDGELVATKPVAETSREDLIRLMVGRTLETFFTRHGQPQQQIALAVNDLKLERAEFRPPAILEGISFDVRAGEILGIAGLLGAGRSELLESIFGAYGSRATGQVVLDGRPLNMTSPAAAIDRGVTLLTEDRKLTGLVLGMSLRHNISLAALHTTLRWGMLSASRERSLARDYIGKLAIHCQGDEQAVVTLSGGNQQKVVLGKWLATEPRVLLLDEPTRGIDVGAKSEIYHLLAELAARGCAIVLASSELPELLNLCDRILVMREGRMSALFDRSEATQERILEAAAPLSRVGALHPRGA